MYRFDLSVFLHECRAARLEREPQRPIAAVVERVVSRSSNVAEVLRPTTAGFTILHREEALTVLHVVWAPHVTFEPHEPRMWSIIGTYLGQQHIRFYRPPALGARRLIESGAVRCNTGGVVVVPGDTIRSVTNPRDVLTGAIHVYGGDLLAQPLRRWSNSAGEWRPFDLAEARRQLADAEASSHARASN